MENAFYGRVVPEDFSIELFWAEHRTGRALRETPRKWRVLSGQGFLGLDELQWPSAHVLQVRVPASGPRPLLRPAPNLSRKLEITPAGASRKVTGNEVRMSRGPLLRVGGSPRAGEGCLNPGSSFEFPCVH